MENEKHERVYFHNLWSVIKRTTVYGVVYSAVREGCPFMFGVFLNVGQAIDYVESQGDNNAS